MNLAERIDAIEPIARRALETAERIETELPERIATAVRDAAAEQRAELRAHLEEAEKQRNASAAERRERYEQETARRDWWLRALIAIGPPTYAAAHALVAELLHR